MILSEISIFDSDGHENLYYATTARTHDEARAAISRRLDHAFVSPHTRAERENWQKVTITMTRRK